VAIHLADQDLAPQRDIKVVLERQPNPRNVTDVARKFLVKVENCNRLVLREERLELAALHPVELKFRAEKPDIYTVTVSDAYKMPLTSRPIEIRDSNVELMQTARDMETLRQWAAISDGLAMKAEDCRDAGDLVGRIKERIEQVRQGIQTRRPIGANAWVLAMVLGCLGGEWALRKRWGLI
jgi:hypothetical protein